MKINNDLNLRCFDAIHPRRRFYGMEGAVVEQDREEWDYKEFAVF